MEKLSDLSTKELINYFRAIGTEKNRQGQARFGIDISTSLGVSMPLVRAKAKELTKSLGPEERHRLAAELWNTGLREVRLLAAMVEVPELVTKRQMDSWVGDFNSWDICDTTCGDLLDKTSFAVEKAIEYSHSNKEFVKRAGFVLMAWLAVHDKTLPNKIFVQFLEIIEKSTTDERNFVRKAVNWALRQIGKSRNLYLYEKSLKLSEELASSSNKTEHWIGQNALTELRMMRQRFPS
jgi:3-methyladenine DNA glycosylase AlkD